MLILAGGLMERTPKVTTGHDILLGSFAEVYQVKSGDWLDISTHKWGARVS